MESVRKGRRRSPRGAAAIEFAILLPVLLAILLGTIDWGYYFFVRANVVNAAREGARVGTLHFDAPLDASGEARAAAALYLANALRRTATSIETTVNADGGACPPQASCLRITYDAGGSVTGFLDAWVPDEIVAYAQMRR